MKFQITDISKTVPTNLEQLGTKEKFWFRHKDDKDYLFKFSRPGTGEHWSEKIACEIAKVLELPNAEYELAINNGQYGVISPSFLGQGDTLILGNQLIEKMSQKSKRRTHIRLSQGKWSNLQEIFNALKSENVSPTLQWRPIWGINDVCDLFLGYLVLDLIVGNTDRHDENWGVLANQGRLNLAPTFDHASSLGRNENSGNIVRITTSKDTNQTVAAYAERAKTPVIAPNAKRLTTYQVVESAVAMFPGSSGVWADQVRRIDAKVIRSLLDRFPTNMLSATRKKFLSNFLLCNSERAIRALEV